MNEADGEILFDPRRQAQLTDYKAPRVLNARVVFPK